MRLIPVYAEFAARQPSRYNPALAGALIQQAGLLGGLSRHGEALGAAQAAVRIYRDLAAAGRGTYLSDLAMALARHPTNSDSSVASLKRGPLPQKRSSSAPACSRQPRRRK